MLDPLQLFADLEHLAIERFGTDVLASRKLKRSQVDQDRRIFEAEIAVGRLRDLE